MTGAEVEGDVIEDSQMKVVGKITEAIDRVGGRGISDFIASSEGTCF